MDYGLCILCAILFLIYLYIFCKDYKEVEPETIPEPDIGPGIDLIEDHPDECVIDGNKKCECGRHAGYSVCASVPGVKNNFNYFFVPEYGLRIPLDQNLTWCFFGSEVVHGTTSPMDIDNSPFQATDVTPRIP